MICYFIHIHSPKAEVDNHWVIKILIVLEEFCYFDHKLKVLTSNLQCI